MISVLAPAKLNLTLEVLGKRQDGFHEICSVMQSINLCDSLRLALSDNMEFKCDMPDWVPEKSLVPRATSLLREVTGCTKGVSMEINKGIPLISGLGGDSSDAAVTLRGLNKLWGLDLPLRELHKLAAGLGSDVSFFLYGGTALVTGRGDIITPLPPFPHLQVILVVPDVPRLPRKTEQMYASLKPYHFTDGKITQRLVEEIKEGKEFNPSLLFNTFENILFTGLSEVNVYKEHMISIGASHVHLAGSGPGLFTMIKDRSRAEELSILFKKQNMVTYLTETIPVIEQT